MSEDNPFMAYFDCGGTFGYDFDVRHYIPEGFIVVDRTRFERLQDYARRIAEEVEGEYSYLVSAGGELSNTLMVLRELRQHLKPGDLDPLP